MNYIWFYVLCINPEHKVAGFMPRLTGRARANYRLKKARGVWNIRRPENYNGLGKFEIWKTGTIYPRCADSYHIVFCDLYNLGREVL